MLKQLATGERPESGPMSFEGDWPGVFIRGDNAFEYAQALRELLGRPGIAAFDRDHLLGLVALLVSSQVQGPHPVKLQRMPGYKQTHLDSETEYGYWMEIGAQLRAEGKI